LPSSPSPNINSNITDNHKRILLVDDEEDITSLFKMALEKNGYEVVAYNDPLEALSKFESNSYDLALLDIKMPTLNGFELYKKLKGVDDSLKVCFVTAFEDYRQGFKQSFPELDEIKCLIGKPIEIRNLVKHVATIIG
jgi:DNA-binding response OmpR family regulator